MTPTARSAKRKRRRRLLHRGCEATHSKVILFYLEKDANKIMRQPSTHTRRIPPTQLVDHSYSTYKKQLPPGLNPTNAVGGSFILRLVGSGRPSRVPNPTNAVGGSFILRLVGSGRPCQVPDSTNAVGGSFILCLSFRDPEYGDR